MDARIDPLAAFGYTVGDAQVLRTAGGRVTAEALAALSVSAAMFGTRRVHVLHHDDCGMHADVDVLRAAIEANALAAPPTELLPVVTDAAAALHDDVAAIAECPWLPEGMTVTGHQFSVVNAVVADAVGPIDRVVPSAVA